MKRLSLPNYVRRSGAKFESTERFLENSVVVDSTSKELDAVGIPLTHVGETKFATAKDELHAFIIGDSGCGKTRRLILPAIRLYAKTHRSMVISDPKGELYKNTADSLKKNGYKVMVLNFRNPSRGSRWNPLGLIENMYRSGDQEEKDRAVLMLKDIIDIMKKEGESEKDRFWENSASKVLMGIALLIMEYGNSGDLTFENISLTSREIFDSIAKEKGRGGRSSFFNVQEENGESASFISFLKTLPKNSPILDNLHAITTVAEDTRNSIIGVFDNMLSVYTNQESLQSLFAASDIDIEDLGKTPTALFFVLPDDSGALYPIATVFVKQIYTTLVNLADNNLHGTLDNRVVFLLDEFANFAKIPSVESMLTAARSRGITFVLVCQSMEQLVDKYGQSGAETLLANCRLWVYMSCRNLPFLQRLEQLIGHYVSPYTGETCPLIDIGELQHFDIGQVLVLNDRCRPVMGYLPDYSKYDFGDDGAFVATDLPEKREHAPRPVFSLSKAMNKALKARIAATPGMKQPDEDAADTLRARIMERIEQRRQAEAQAAGNQGEVPAVDTSSLLDGFFAHSRKVNELFKAGKLVEAAQYSIDHMDAPGISKNNLAFLIRRGRISYEELSAPFSVTVRDLLEDGVAAGEPYSMLNLALHCIAAKMYKQAVELLEKLTKDGWGSVLQFWHGELWENMSHDPEGALVCLLAAKRKIVSWPDEELKAMEEAVKESYNDFLTSEEIKKLEVTEDDSSTPDETDKDSSAESWLGFDWLSDDDDDDDDDDDETTGNTSQSSSVADLKAMLQRKIQQKLKETEDDE